MKSDGEYAVLLSHAIAGNRDSFETLLKEMYPRLLAYIEKKIPKNVVGSIDAMDVLQDTYFEAWRLIKGFQPQGNDSLFRWLATIARHRMIDLARKGKSRRNEEVNIEGDNGEVVSLLEQLVVYRRTPSRSARAHELMEKLQESLEQLPLAQRAVVTCRYIEGLSVSETAEKLGRSNQAISLVCFRALETIREELRSRSRFL